MCCKSTQTQCLQVLPQRATNLAYKAYYTMLPRYTDNRESLTTLFMHKRPVSLWKTFLLAHSQLNWTDVCSRANKALNYTRFTRENEGKIPKFVMNDWLRNTALVFPFTATAPQLHQPRNCNTQPLHRTMAKGAGAIAMIIWLTIFHKQFYMFLKF